MIRVRAVPDRGAGFTRTVVQASSASFDRNAANRPCDRTGERLVSSAVSTDPNLQRIDRFGLVASTICAIHCALMPILLLAVPTLFAVVGIERWLEQVVVIVAVLLAGYSAWRQVAEGQWATAGMFAVGIVVLIASRLVPHGRPGELVAIAGSLFVAFAHARSLSHGRRLSAGEATDPC